MNKHLHNSLRALFLSLAVLLSLPMLAVEIDRINYGLDAEAKQATVIKMSSDKYYGKIAIPASVEYNGITYSVTSIGDSFSVKTLIFAYQRGLFTGFGLSLHLD